MKIDIENVSTSNSSRFNCRVGCTGKDFIISTSVSFNFKPITIKGMKKILVEFGAIVIKCNAASSISPKVIFHNILTEVIKEVKKLESVSKYSEYVDSDTYTTEEIKIIIK